MDDLISRQAAIDAMDECYWSIMGDEPPKLDEKTALYVDLTQAVKRLPSAQPEPIKINIDHELTKDEYEKLRKDLADAPVVLLPTAQPERKTGRWILHENQRQEDVDNGNYLYICSECGKSDIHAKTQEVPFCWWCGSKMEVSMMDDLISRQAAIKALQKEINKGIPPFDDVIGSIRCGVRLARNIIEDLPTAEKKGKWIDYCGGVKCDQCGFECDDTYYLGEANFCPNCGCRMTEE